MYKEYYVYQTTFTSLAAGTGTVFTPNEIRIDSDSEFEFIKTHHSPPTARVRLRYRDDTSGRYLGKGSQDIRTISGHSRFTMAPGNPTPPGFAPFIWPRPYKIAAATTFSVEAADYSGLGGTFYLSFHGNKVRQGEAPWEKQPRAILPYMYPISASGTVQIPANGTISASIATDNDAAFVVHKIVGARDGECTVTIKDGARDRQWMNTPVHFDNLVGNGHYPNMLPSLRYIARGSVIAVTLQDLSGVANDVELTFIGVKLYE